MKNTTFHYVYILSSQSNPAKKYIDSSTNLKSRLQSHNAGQCSYTQKHRPWQIETALSFRSQEKAIAFEKYLKTGSGRAFSKRHF